MIYTLTDSVLVGKQERLTKKGEAFYSVSLAKDNQIEQFLVFANNQEVFQAVQKAVLYKPFSCDVDIYRRGDFLNKTITKVYS